MTSKKRTARTLTYEDGTRLRDDAIERGTRVFFGKEYHWARTPENVLTLRKGPDPLEIRTFADMFPETATILQEAGTA